MNFSIIAPTAGLKEFATLSKTHLVLSHVRNMLYWNFYTEREQEGDLIILDNSEYEGERCAQRLIECLDYLDPDIIVLPDRLGEGKETFELSRNFLRDHARELHSDFMYVCQCNGTIEGFHEMRQHIRLMKEMYGIKWFGLPRYLSNHGISRAELCLWIKRLENEWGDECYVHALGMSDASLRELCALDDAQCDSIDSSAPVWRGWNGFGIENRSGWLAHGTKCDFDAHPNTLTQENRELILKNLQKVGVAC